jgi:hypothetical protein
VSVFVAVVLLSAATIVLALALQPCWVGIRASLLQSWEVFELQIMKVLFVDWSNGFQAGFDVSTVLEGAGPSFFQS